MLYPRASASRQIIDLGGLWSFQLDRPDSPCDTSLAAAPLPDARPMAVPASYNDQTQDPALRDHVGWAWYQTRIYPQADWPERSVELRVGAACHHCRIFLDGVEIGSHRGGYLPWAADITAHLRPGQAQLLSIAVDNRLDLTTLPPGTLQQASRPGHPADRLRQDYYHDFFNYAGIHRPVRLTIRPRTHITDIAVEADFDPATRTGTLQWSVSTSAETGVVVRLLDRDGHPVVDGQGSRGDLVCPDCTPWQPGLGGLYDLEVQLPDSGDVYRLPVGFRRVALVDGQLQVNAEPVYLRGFGKHEDLAVIGKGHSDAWLVKDFSLLEWIGANSFRTSHYPYAEEVMNLADEQGILVIDECPAVGQWDKAGPIFDDGRIGEAALTHHCQVLHELHRRDRHHPCVIAWSVANEPASWEPACRPYFEQVVATMRELDPVRPVMLVLHQDPAANQIADLCDILGLNRYMGWYEDPGELGVIEGTLEHDLRTWHERFGKPIVVTEYGADTIAGFHQDPPTMFTEEYQCAFLDAYHRVFDRLDFVIGEQVWNFADFQTKQGITRIDGNKKGIFTRDRRPKMAAHLLRRRWRGADANVP